MRKIVLIGTVALLALAFTAVGGATPPASDTFGFTYSDTLSCSGLGFGFDDNFAGSVSIRETTFFDSKGNAIRIQDHVAAVETNVNSVTGKSFVMRGDVTIVQDLVSGTWSWNGAANLANETGRGIVIHDTGKIVFDANGDVVFEGGPHQVIDIGPEVFCAALA